MIYEADTYKTKMMLRDTLQNNGIINAFPNTNQPFPYLPLHRMPPNFTDSIRYEMHTGYTGRHNGNIIIITSINK